MNMTSNFQKEKNAFALKISGCPLFKLPSPSIEADSGFINGSKDLTSKIQIGFWMNHEDQKLLLIRSIQKPRRPS